MAPLIQTAQSWDDSCQHSDRRAEEIRDCGAEPGREEQCLQVTCELAHHRASKGTCS